MIDLFYLTTKQTNNMYELGDIICQTTGELLSLFDLIDKYDYAFVNDNFNLVWADICKQLNNAGYDNDFEIKANKQYSFIYQSGSCLEITIRNEKGKYTRIVNFAKKFNTEFSDLETNQKLLAYAEQKDRHSITLGNDAFQEWLRYCFKVRHRTLNVNACRSVFRREYPVLSDSETNICETAKNYVAGFQYVKTGRFQNLYYYDICSSFPAQLLNATPKGAPIKLNSVSEVKPNYFYIVKFTSIGTKLKPNCIDAFNCKDICTLTLTEHSFNLFKKNYTYTAIQEHFVLAFKTRANQFSDFVYDNVIKGKEQETDKDIARYNKAIANSVVGYFGKRTITEQNCIMERNGKKAILTRKIKSQPIYQPIYLFVNGKAKLEFIDTLQRIVGIDNLVYANTDGFLTTKPIDLNMLNFGRGSVIGCFKFKCKFVDIQINSINGYVGITDTGKTEQVVSGVSLTGAITPEQYSKQQFSYDIHEFDENTGLICTRHID